MTADGVDMDSRALGLTPRQSDVLKLLMQGKPNKLICRDLQVAEGTVKAHVRGIFRALHVHSRTEAIAALARRGISVDMLSDSSVLYAATRTELIAATTHDDPARVTTPSFVVIERDHVDHATTCDQRSGTAASIDTIERQLDAVAQELGPKRIREIALTLWRDLGGKRGVYIRKHGSSNAAQDHAEGAIEHADVST